MLIVMVLEAGCTVKYMFLADKIFAFFFVTQVHSNYAPSPFLYAVSSAVSLK